jgi:hypothetical protein
MNDGICFINYSCLANTSKLPQVAKFSENQLKFNPEVDAWASKCVNWPFTSPYQSGSGSGLNRSDFSSED